MSPASARSSSTQAMTLLAKADMNICNWSSAIPLRALLTRFPNFSRMIGGTGTSRPLTSMVTCSALLRR